MNAADVRVAVWVHPGASRTSVGAFRAEPGLVPGHEGVLEIWVTQRAVDGKATEAALRALADAFGVRRATVRLVTGARARVKIVSITDPPADLLNRLGQPRDA